MQVKTDRKIPTSLEYKSTQKEVGCLPGESEIQKAQSRAGKTEFSRNSKQNSERKQSYMRDYFASGAATPHAHP
jgi:hypothetical protein